MLNSPLGFDAVPVLIIAEFTSRLDVHRVSHLTRPTAYVPHEAHLAIHHLNGDKVLLYTSVSVVL